MKASFFKPSSLLVAIAAGTAMMALACNKFLDQQPITSLGPDQVFADVASARQSVIAAYSRLTGDQGYGIRISLYYPLDEDCLQGPTGNADNDRRDIARYSLTPGNAQLDGPFRQLFTGIEYSNICIDNIPKMELYSSGSEQQRAQLRRLHGEALTLRAQFYFEAIRNWGDLPQHFAPGYVLAAGDPFPARTHQDTLYNRLLADLELAATLVPWRNEVTALGDVVDERITKGAVKALRARIALYRAGFALRQNGNIERGSNPQVYYQMARKECQEIVASGQHGLNPDFRALWKDQVCARAVNDPQGELMFQVTGIGGGASADTKLGYYNGPRVNNFGNSSVNPLPTYFYLFDSTDQRRDVTIAIYNVAANGATKIGQPSTAMNEGKFRRDWMTNPVIPPSSAAQYFQLKWQLIRYADVLLMLAEAENELNGPSATAYQALNQVRRRGYGKSISSSDPSVDAPAGLSKDDFFKFIVRERALEFGGEGIRKFDLKRWNLMEAAINDTKANLLRMSNLQAPVNPSYQAGYPSYVLGATLPTFMYFNTTTTGDNNNVGNIWLNSFYVAGPTATTIPGFTRVNWMNAAINTSLLSRYATNFQKGKSELMPIPQPARDANRNLTQNPGY